MTSNKSKKKVVFLKKTNKIFADTKKMHTFALA